MMKRLAQRWLYWTPRVLCIVFAAFISIFALDVFREGGGFWRTALALLMHLLPTFLLLAVLVLSWRREWFGGILFIVLGILYIFWAWNKPFARWYVFLMIAGPPVLVGALFLLNWRHRAELRPGS
jgi:ABC-type multidrug transport system permease subunit